MSLCESCIRNKDCEWNKGNPRHCTLYTDKEETNFERITKSPEALAEWLSNTFDLCDRGCSHCVIGIERCVEERPNGKDTEDLVLEWLKQESK